MGRWGNRLREAIVPPVPEAIRDDLILLTAGDLQRQARILFLALLVTTPTAFLAASAGATWWIRAVAPVAMGLFCLAGFLSLSRDLRIAGSVRRSARLMRESTVSSCLIAVLCSAWCVYSWLGAAPADRIYYPFIIAMGTFATAYCLASVRVAAIGNLAINLIPMSVLLLFAGTRMDVAAGVSLIVAALFQLRMIAGHHDNIVRLLMAERRAREQALTDPLTGLMNRRALLDTAMALGREGPLRLLLVDIDHFKAINDGHGHDCGDEVLREIAARLAAKAELRASVARIGGEEFALVGTVEDLPESLALAILADIRTAAMPHGGQVTVSIGVSEGAIDGENDWRGLFQAADVALYRAKAAGRNRVDSASLADVPSLPERRANRAAA